MSTIISTSTTSGIVLTNTASNPVTVTGTINLTTGSTKGGYALYGQNGGGAYSWTITNSGTIKSTANHGLDLGKQPSNYVAGGTITNLAGGYILGTSNAIAYGVGVFGPATLVNANGATIKGQAGGVGINGSATVTNSGLIIGDANGGGGGVYLFSGTVTNSANATISGQTGVLVHGNGAATITNFGTIIGTSGTSAGAVRFSGNNTADRIIANPGAVFTGGGLYGGKGVLELASAASAQTLSPLHITNFATIQFDSANWLLGGKYGELGPSTISGFVAGDTIDLTDFAATSSSFSGGVLTLTKVGKSTTTLSFQGSFTESQFTIASDGVSGTNIMLASVPQTFSWKDGSADWTTAAAWDLGTVPTATDTAVIANAGSNTVSIGSGESIAIDNVTIAAGNTLAVTGTIAANSITDNAALSFIGSHTIDQTPLSLAGTLSLQGAGTLTLGTNEPITQSGLTAKLSSTTSSGEAIVNQGTISAAIAGGSLAIVPLNFTNQGTIAVNNEALTIGFNDGKVGGVRGPWSNSGTIALSGTASLILDGSLATAGIGTITGASGVTEAGLLDNTGATLHVGTGTQLGTVNLANAAVVSGGTIVNHGNGFTFNRNGTFSGVTFQGPLDLASNNALLNVTGGLTVIDSVGTGPGAINLTEGGDAIISFINSQSIDNATFNLNGTDSFNPLTEIDIGGANNSVLTFGTNVTISSTAANTQADIRNTLGAQTSVVNKGTIVAAASHDAKHVSSLAITPVQGFNNQGTILVSNGELVSIQPGFGTFDNSGIVSVSGASTLQISGSAIAPSINNSGTITLANGTTLDLAGFYTPASLGNLVNQGATTKIEGVLDAQNGTITLGSGTLLDHVVLSGNLRNGTFQPKGSLTIASVNASLLNAKLEGPLALTADFTNLTLNEGVTLSDATGTQIGTLDVTSQGNSLILQNLIASNASGQTLDNVRINIGNAQTIDNIQPTFFGGTLTIGSGATIASTSAGALVNFHPGSKTTVDFQGTLLASGAGGAFTVSGTGGGFASTLRNNGLMQIGNNDLLSLTAPIAGGTGTISLGTGGRVDFAAGIAAGQTVAFTDATGKILLNQPGSFAATVLGFAAGDTIDIPGTVATSAIWSSGQLTISNGGGTIAVLSLPEDYSAATFHVAGDGGTGTAVTVTATCYAAGTRILTPQGEVPIERLREGDLVLTFSGGVQPIVWIGHRRVDFRRHPNRERVLPVHIAAHAFGIGRPKRDLLLSPDHAIFTRGVLIPVRHLLNGSTIVQLERRSITYWHVELPRHDVLLAEGLPAESYLDAGARNAFANGKDAVQLHPDFASPRQDWALLWETEGYAPLVIAGETLDRARRALARQATLLAAAGKRPQTTRFARASTASNSTCAPASASSG